MGHLAKFTLLKKKKNTRKKTSSRSIFFLDRSFNFVGVYQLYNSADLQFYKVPECDLFIFTGARNITLIIFHIFLVFIIINKNCLSFEKIIFYSDNNTF